MSIQETINQHLTRLPEYLQAEILDFVIFVEHKNQPKSNPDTLLAKDQRQKNS